MSNYAFPIIFMFVSIILTVFGFGFLFYKFAKITDASARKIEIVGYMLLFCLIIWSFYIKNIMCAEFYSNDFTIIQKLNEIFLAITNPDYESYRFWEWHKTRYIQRQLLCIDIIELILQVSSTVCIAIGRFQEIKKTKSK